MSECEIGPEGQRAVYRVQQQRSQKRCVAREQPFSFVEKLKNASVTGVIEDVSAATAWVNSPSKAPDELVSIAASLVEGLRNVHPSRGESPLFKTSPAVFERYVSAIKAFDEAMTRGSFQVRLSAEDAKETSAHLSEAVRLVRDELTALDTNGKLMPTDGSPAPLSLGEEVATEGEHWLWRWVPWSSSRTNTLTLSGVEREEGAIY